MCLKIKMCRYRLKNKFSCTHYLGENIELYYCAEAPYVLFPGFISFSPPEIITILNFMKIVSLFLFSSYMNLS